MCYVKYAATPPTDRKKRVWCWYTDFAEETEASTVVVIVVVEKDGSVPEGGEPELGVWAEMSFRQTRYFSFESIVA